MRVNKRFLYIVAGMLSFLAVGFLGICVLFPEFTGSGEPEEPVFALEEIREEIPQSAAQGEAAPAADIVEDAGSEETRTAEDP